MRTQRFCTHIRAPSLWAREGDMGDITGDRNMRLQHDSYISGPCFFYLRLKEVLNMLNQKYRFTYDEVRIIVMALVELKNSLIAEGRYTDPVDELLVRFVD